MNDVAAFPSGVNISAEADRLIDTIEAGGLDWHVMQSKACGLFLAFEHSARAADPRQRSEGVEASRQLARLIAENDVLRQRLADHALSVGSYYRAA